MNRKMGLVEVLRRTPKDLDVQVAARNRDGVKGPAVPQGVGSLSTGASSATGTRGSSRWLLIPADRVPDTRVA